ncbi:LANO_0H07866g1_1 [Lachancea nothofagi CBS 11611]|uniref:LANO_0H07866g1_1 n=1 Tax=Lachancea nothofagi CBS 11611 TaxID=1266666 RepID=A0A1G4KM21_9SACH|nr:LANO_0H07866g1_1 [Lachancea nothofagi CBS 11611]
MSDTQNKRRRVTRACDECRKKKVKCDGQQPCIHCTVYSYECTYNQPSKRVSTQQPATGTPVSTGPLKSQDSGAPVSASFPRPQRSNSSLTRTYRNAQMQSLSKYKSLFNQLFPQMPNIEQLDVSAFVKTIQSFTASNRAMQDALKERHLSIQDGNYSSESPVTNPGTATMTPEFMADAIEGIDGSIQSLEGREIKIILPPKPVALHFIHVTWEQCCVLFRFYHRPSFIANLDELYETDPHDYTHEQMHFLPLCYSVMAVGALFSKSMQKTANATPEDTASSPNQFMQDEGYKYFVAARKLIDITNARDLNSLQAIVMLFIFLQCSARLSTCYTYIGVAMRNALREGMHRNLNTETHGYNPIEIEMRKRLFYTIYKMDVYVNTMLGLPRSVSQRDFDQAFPAELTDEYITKTGLDYDKQGDVLSSAGIANHHTRLIMILDNIVAELYPVKKTNSLISHDVVTQLEIKLRRWLDNLPPELTPGLSDVPSKYERANQLLHLSFLQVQVILYRPFIHYLSAILPAKATDSLSIQRARNCISVARTVVKLAKKMMEKKTLTGSYWFSIYNIFFSVAGLIFYLHEVTPVDDDGEAEYREIQNDAEMGKSVLLYLKDTSMAANRTYNLLNMLFEKFNSKTIKWSHVKQDEYNASMPNSNDQVPVKSPPINVGNEPNSYNLDNNNMDLLAFENPQDSALQTTSTISGVNMMNTMNTMNSSSMLMNKDYGGANNDVLEMDNFFDLGNNNISEDKPIISQASNTLPKEEYEPPIDANASESYVPGAFDQLDVQLFGRYLPPYMSQ